MRVLTVNTGSSSVKLRVVEADGCVGAEASHPGEAAGDPAVLADFLDSAGPLDAVGHRLVHGGSRFAESVVVDEEVRAALGTRVALAPLHLPPALAALDALVRLRPGLPVVACFDTAFHASLPEAASGYALPREWVERWGLRRFGFHGLSCSWAWARTAERLGWGPGEGRAVLCHLGAGASATAVVGGRSLDTTMGLTPLEGLVMATRPGDVDPGLLLWLLGHGVGLAALDAGLQYRSGLAALWRGPDGDLRAVLEARRAGDAQAARAMATYTHRLRAKVAAMAAASGGIDALVFTGGVGEHASEVRAEACAGLAFLGVELDADANRLPVGPAPITDLSTPGAAVRVLVVPAREDAVIAAECRRLLGRARGERPSP
jgi:acetate kinase